MDKSILSLKLGGFLGISGGWINALSPEAMQKASPAIQGSAVQHRKKDVHSWPLRAVAAHSNSTHQSTATLEYASQVAPQTYKLQVLKDIHTYVTDAKSISSSSS